MKITSARYTLDNGKAVTISTSGQHVIVEIVSADGKAFSQYPISKLSCQQESQCFWDLTKAALMAMYGPRKGLYSEQPNVTNSDARDFRDTLISFA